MSLPSTSVPKKKKGSNIKHYDPHAYDSYIKKLDEGFLDKISKEHNENGNNIIKPDIDVKVNHMNLLQRRLNKKATELDSKEGQLNIVKQELELKGIELLKQLEYKEAEIAYIKDRFREERAQLIQDKENLTNENISLQKQKEDLEHKIVVLNKTQINIKSQRALFESEEANKENISMKKVIQIQKEKIKALENELKNTIINSHKEKEGIYTQRISALEKINKELLSKVNFNEEYQQQFKDQLCLLLMKDKNNTNDHGSSNVIKKSTEHKIFTFKNGMSCAHEKKDKLERLLKEKDVLINNGNYSKNDALILRLDEKINKIITSNNQC